jgi:hypothetical protein
MLSPRRSKAPDYQAKQPDNPRSTDSAPPSHLKVLYYNSIPFSWIAVQSSTEGCVAKDEDDEDDDDYETTYVPA